MDADRRILRVQEELTSGMDAITYSIAAAAFDIFRRAGCEDDFCFQCTGASSVVFGSINRLIWDAKNGFYPDREYCTVKFLTFFPSEVSHG